MNKSMTTRILALVGLALVLGGCLGGGGGSSGSGMGSLTLSVTDAPVAEADEVVVSFTGATVKPESGEAVEFEFEEIRTIDLLTLTGSAHEVLLDAESVPAGRYEWIRLHVISDDNTYSYILIDGDPKPLRVPSGDQTGLKLVDGFTVPEDGHAAYTIDFDLTKAVTCPPGLGGTCLLRPAMRLVAMEVSGTLAGTVHPDVIAAAQGLRDACFGAVYVYDADVNVPADVGGPEAREPLTTTVVNIPAPGAPGTYEVGFLPAGFYLPVFTCDQDLDDPDAFDNETEIVVRLLEGDVVEVVSGKTTVYDFTP
jgi:hypothetical protein